MASRPKSDRAVWVTAVRVVALVITLVWAGFWTWFGLASGVSEGLPLPLVFAHTAVPGLLCFASAFAAWKWPFPGGLALLAQSVGFTILYGVGIRHPWRSDLLLAATLPGPALVAGLLYLAAWSRVRKATG